MKKGNLIVISGPSGAGKGTICKALLEREDNLYISVSATTRSPRKGEVNGVNYYFLTQEEFKKKVDNNEFLEWAEVHGNYYGTPKFNVEEMINEGKNIILEIDVQGALNVKKNCEDGVFIFILPPSMEELKRRIIARGSETPESLIKRFKTAYEEINYISKYNYAVVNDDLEEAVKKVQNILYAEDCRVSNIDYDILDFKEGLINGKYND
ncbi:MAG: guanylate kinase [Clostridium sp.]|jgi:guanylate kinase|nr:guanylate kinase [Clostridium sp.]